MKNLIYIGIDLATDIDHTILTIKRIEKSKIEILGEFYDKKAKMMYNSLNENKSLKNELNFLRKRENKLQLIEQMFRSGIVDLEKLTNLVKENEV